MQPINVTSEIGPLKRVIIHRPDEGIARISPRRATELLFDDIVHLPNMQEEHDVFTNVLKAFVGKNNVLDTKHLLEESLACDGAIKLETIEQIIDYEELPRFYVPMLMELTNDRLAEVLITGYFPEEEIILFDPIPNFIFTRDIAVVVNDHVIVTKAAKEARFRENFLTRFILWVHPMFEQVRTKQGIIDLNKIDDFPPSRRGEWVSVEGGDVMILNSQYLLVGCSERSSGHGLKSLREKLFEKNVIQNVVQLNVPHDRSYMHIDTIFTQIHFDQVVAFKPIIMDGMSSNVEVYRKDGAPAYYPNLKDFLLDEINPSMQFILSGKGVSPYQEREQWTDGCNLVAIKPGVALTYDRNPWTEKAFMEAGYNILHAHTFMELYNNKHLNPGLLENTIITLPSNELSRARGGSHCMTCPVERGGGVER